MTAVSSIASLILDLPPSCIAFCPSRPEYFVIGTYFLHPKGGENITNTNPAQDDENASFEPFEGERMGDQSLQKRTGSLILFRLDGNTITQIVTKQAEFAILDIQWTPHSHQFGDLLAVATSTGAIEFYRLDLESGKYTLTFLSRKVVADPSLLVLSIAWHPVQSHVIGFTLSDGSVSLAESPSGNLDNQDEVMQIREIHHHELEAWTFAFAGKDCSDVISGGDDVVLRCSAVSNENAIATWKDRKLHQAGVTAILPLTSDLVVTGSYDDHIRLVSGPAAGRRQVKASLNLGGGVWRMKFLDRRTRTPSAENADQGSDNLPEIQSAVILASCMHAGSRVIRLCKGQDGEGEWTFEVVAKFEEHQSMNYGSDVQPGNGQLKSIISTSFYDKLLCLWQFDMKSVDRGDG